MQTAEYNHDDFSNQTEADKGLMVRFFYKNVQNKMESQKQGRPIFKEKLYVEIRVPGQRDVQACRPATHADKNRFPAHLEAFEKRVEAPTEGMPLIEWPKITRSQAEELAFMNVKTIEQLAGMKDSNIQQFMGGYALREKAIKWLEFNDTANADREKDELKATVVTLQAQVAQLLALQDPSTTATGSTLESKLDEEDEPEKIEIPDEEKAVVVQAAPAAKKSTRKSRRNK